MKNDRACSVRSGFPTSCAVLAVLILLRDGMRLPVGRPLLLLAVLIPLLFFRAEETWLFCVFLLPLYPGLPGNYITLLLIGKLIFLAYREPARYRVSRETAAAVLLFSLYIEIQNLALGELSVYSFALGAELLLLLLLASDGVRPPVDAVASVFSFSVLLSGTAALLVFAGEHSFQEIFSGAVRFGDAYETDGMHMTLDPNFLGFSCLAGIAANAELLRHGACLSKKAEASALCTKKAVLLFHIAALFFFGVIGLSRTFLLCAGGLAALELAACAKEPRLFFRCVIFLFAFCTGAAAAAAMLAPDLAEVLIGRFSAADLAGANGRAELIFRWYEEFTSSFRTLFFGVGLFRTNVHMTALQYLFGLGLVGSCLAAAAFVRLLRVIGFRAVPQGSIPAVVLSVMSCAVPAACSLSALFPLIFSFSVSAGLEGRLKTAEASAF